MLFNGVFIANEMSTQIQRHRHHVLNSRLRESPPSSSFLQSSKEYDKHNDEEDQNSQHLSHQCPIRLQIL